MSEPCMLQAFKVFAHILPRMSSAEAVQDSSPNHMDASALDISAPPLDSSECSLSVSATFYPGAQIRPAEVDIVLLTPDCVFFYANSKALLSHSKNGFNSLLPAVSTSPDCDAIIAVPESSEVLNVVLHAIYSLPGSHYDPSMATLNAAITALETYGIDLHSLNRHPNLLFSRLLFYAPATPLDVYVIAARNNLDDIATSCSSHLLSFPLEGLSDEKAEAMGPLYLKRLFFLHIGRSQALKELLLPLPLPHAPIPNCDFADQKKLTRAWALASAPLAWETRPDTPTISLESALSQCSNDLQCGQCRENIQKHIRAITVQWSLVKRTI